MKKTFSLAFIFLFSVFLLSGCTSFEQKSSELNEDSVSEDEVNNLSDELKEIEDLLDSTVNLEDSGINDGFFN